MKLFILPNFFTFKELNSVHIRPSTEDSKEISQKNSSYKASEEKAIPSWWQFLPDAGWLCERGSYYATEKTLEKSIKYAFKLLKKCKNGILVIVQNYFNNFSQISLKVKKTSDKTENFHHTVLIFIFWCRLSWYWWTWICISSELLSIKNFMILLFITMTTGHLGAKVSSIFSLS